LGDLVPGEGEPTADGVVYGDSAYGTGAHLAWLEQQRLRPMVKTQLPTQLSDPILTIRAVGLL